MNAEHDRNIIYLLIATVLGVILFISFTFYAASGGVRGSDQYWYVDDVAALLEGKGSVSNCIYPASVFQGAAQFPRPFVHNIPISYIVFLAALFAGPFYSWIIINLLSSLAAAFFIGLTVKHSTGNTKASFYAGLSYLLLPVVFWNSTQALSEPSLGFFVSLFVYIYVSRKPSFWYFFLLIFVSGILFLSKSNFIILFPIILAAFLIGEKGKPYKRTVGVLAIYIIFIYFISLLKVFFKSNFDPSYIDVFMMDTLEYPGNMAHFYAVDNLKFDLISFLEKNIHNLTIQIIPGNIASFFLYYFPFNLSISIIIVLLCRHKEYIADRSVSAGIIFVSIFIITIMVFQNQFRYQLMAWPAILVSLFCLSSKLFSLNENKMKIRNENTVLSFILLGVTMIFYVLSQHAKDSGELEHRVVKELQQQTREIPESESIMIIEKGEARQLIAHALQPRLVLSALPNYIPEKYIQLVELADCKWLLIQENEVSKLQKKYIRKVSIYYDNFNLYKLERK